MARVVLIPLDDSDACGDAVKFYKSNIYAPGDAVHLVHAIPRSATAPPLGVPSLESVSPGPESEALRAAEGVLFRRALETLDGLEPTPVAHLIRCELDTDSIGAMVCAKAAELGASLVVVARHSRSKFQELLLGSVTNYCIHNCPCALLVHQ